MDEVRNETGILPEGTEVFGETTTKTVINLNGIGRVMFISTLLFEQDYYAYHRLLFSRRTQEFSEQEVKGWQEAWDIIGKIHSYDFKKIKDKYKMQIFSEEESKPYKDWPDDEVILQRWQDDPITQENWQVMDRSDRLRFGEKNE